MIEWRPIKDFPGYEVSSAGEIRSWLVANSQPALPRSLRQYNVRGGHNKHAYKQTVLYGTPGVRSYRYTHRLIAEAFIPNPDNKSQVNHKDGNTSNNAVENLEWATPKENMGHALHNGLIKVGSGANNAKLTDQLVQEIREKCKTRSCNDVAREYGLSGRHVGGIKRYESWRHLLSANPENS